MNNKKCLELEHLEREIKHLRERLYDYQFESELTKPSIIGLSEKLDRKIIQFMKLSNQLS